MLLNQMQMRYVVPSMLYLSSYESAHVLRSSRKTLLQIFLPSEMQWKTVKRDISVAYVLRSGILVGKKVLN